MSFNASFKGGLFLRSDLDFYDSSRKSKNDIIRTDFLLENVFSYSLGDNYKFCPVSAINKKEKDTLEKIIKLYDLFGDRHGHFMSSLCKEFTEITEDTIDPILLGVAKEIFSGVISWSQIICYFYFVGQLAVMCIDGNLPKSTVDVTYESFSRFVKTEIEPWIKDHDDWERFLSLTIKYENSSSTDIEKSSCIKFLLYSAIKIIGNLLKIL